MQTITVGLDGDYKSINDALLNTNPEKELTLILKAGVFEEKIFSKHKNLHIIGQGMDKTVITWHDGAMHRHSDGQNIGTFRSYTACFDGDILTVSNLTIQNTAGEGKTNGQAIAAAVYTKFVNMQNVRLKSYQDTLFLGPLPPLERQNNGFLGPFQKTPRILSYQLYENCDIFGDVDFIFGGADAVFSHCNIHAIGERDGFLSAPSGFKKDLGMIFEHCTITAEKKNSLRLARPWRSEGKAIFLYCDMTDAVSDIGFDCWAEKEQTYYFCEYPEHKNRKYCFYITDDKAKEFLNLSDKHKTMIKEQIKYTR